MNCFPMDARLESLNATAAPQIIRGVLALQPNGILKQSTPHQTHPHGRKRIRHRPNRRLRALSVFSSASNDHTTRTRNDTIQPSSSVPAHDLDDDSDYYRSMLRRQESAESRDRRMFGGLDDDTESARDLRGAMLDVVLGLFNGLDYDDSTMCSKNTAQVGFC